MDELENMGVHELRTFARNFGVKTPTAKRRQVLLDEIEQIAQGKLKPYRNGHYGRPVKVHVTNDNLFAKGFTGIGEELQSKLVYETPEGNQGILNFQQKLKEMEKDNPFQIVEAKGILRRTNNGEYYFVNQMKPDNVITMVDTRDVLRYRLMVGDLVEGFSENIPNTNFAKFKKLVLVDEKEAFKNNYDSEMEFVLPEKLVDDSGLKYGQSTLICSKDKDSAIKFIETKVNEMKKPNTKFIVVGLNCSTETKLKLSQVENTIQFIATNAETSMTQKEVLSDAYNYTNSLFYHGYDVVVFFLNILSNFEILDTAFKCNDEHSEEVVLMASKALTQCKASKDSSITVFGLYYENQTTLYQKELKILNRILNS